MSNPNQKVGWLGFNGTFNTRFWLHHAIAYVHTNLYSTKNCENESEALAQDD